MDSQQDAALHLQVVALQSMLPQLDSEWDALHRSIRSDEHRLAALQEWQQQLSFLLEAVPHAPACQTAALKGHLGKVEQQIREAIEAIASKKRLCWAIEHQFDELRLALSLRQHVAYRREQRD